RPCYAAVQRVLASPRFDPWIRTWRQNGAGMEVDGFGRLQSDPRHFCERHRPPLIGETSTAECIPFSSLTLSKVRCPPLMPKRAIDVAVGGKADMPVCTAHVCF